MPATDCRSISCRPGSLPLPAEAGPTASGLCRCNCSPRRRVQASKSSHDRSYATGAKCLLEWVRDKEFNSSMYTPTTSQLKGRRDDRRPVHNFASSDVAGLPMSEPATAGDQTSDLVAAEDRRGAAAFNAQAFRSIVIRWDGACRIVQAPRI
jgi:hypothetical protein